MLPSTSCVTRSNPDMVTKAAARMKRERAPRTVRRSVALPSQLLESAMAAAPPEVRGKVNRLVRVALEEFVARRKARAFERSMAEMAADPEIAYQSRALSEEFSSTEADGLPEP